MSESFPEHQEIHMTAGQDRSLDMFCTALEMKERKKNLYEDAMKACPDQVGIETFRMLRDAEEEHVKHIQEIYETAKKGKISPDVCKYHDFQTEDKQTVLRKIAKEHGMMPKACVDDVVAIEIGMQLENTSIQFFQKELDASSEPVEREFLENMLKDEREHYVLLADLKYYYTDPESWFMEKSRSRLDGAGAVT
jgi:rubrerythrin